MNKDHTEKFNLNKLNERYREKSSIMLRSRVGLQPQKIWKLRWVLIVHGKQLEGISTFQPKSIR
jgi:hypothetical protein